MPHLSDHVKGAVGRISKIQVLAKEFEHQQLLSPYPLSAKAQNGLLSPSPHKENECA